MVFFELMSVGIVVFTILLSIVFFINTIMLGRK